MFLSQLKNPPSLFSFKLNSHYERILRYSCVPYVYITKNFPCNSDVSARCVPSVFTNINAKFVTQKVYPTVRTDSTSRNYTGKFAFVQML